MQKENGLDREGVTWQHFIRVAVAEVVKNQRVLVQRAADSMASEVRANVERVLLSETVDDLSNCPELLSRLACVYGVE